jgi:hypothetical protein
MRFQTAETPQFRPGERVVIAASDRYPATVGRTGTVCTVSAMHGERVPDGEFTVDGVRDVHLDLMFGSPTFTGGQLRHATDTQPEETPMPQDQPKPTPTRDDYPTRIPSRPV